MGKNYKANKDKRDSGGFLALPHAVIESHTFRALGFSSRALLIDIARQYSGTNNGRLVACEKYLKPLGWNSNATRSKALHELLDSGLLIRTRMGYKPNRAAWYALAWYQLDVSDGMDLSNAEFLRLKPLWKNTAPTPITGVAVGGIAPKSGAIANGVIPITGAMRSKTATLLHQ